MYINTLVAFSDDRVMGWSRLRCGIELRIHTALEEYKQNITKHTTNLNYSTNI